MAMKIAILGGTGFIGKRLVQRCQEQGHHVYLLTRHPENKQDHTLSFIKWPIPEQDLPLTFDAVINLAGETINQRWTTSAKSAILHSRVQTTQTLVRMLEQGLIKTPMMVNGSAVGYYGHSDTEVFNEESTVSPQDFLAEVVHAWEKEADKIPSLGIRVIKARFGVVLDLHGGALPKMILPYKLFVGGRMGSGKQYLSWIHLDDAVNLILYCIEQETMQGAVNFTAPHPVNMEQFGQNVAKVLRRPHWLPAPSFAFRIAMGEMADLLLKGQQAIPQKALQSGFKFRFPELNSALESLFWDASK